MTEGRQFCKWLMFVLFIILGISKGIPAALILSIPEPLPKLARATEVAIVEAWDGPGDFRQSQMLDMLSEEIQRIQMDAELEMFGIRYELSTDCGRTQDDIGTTYVRSVRAWNERHQ